MQWIDLSAYGDIRLRVHNGNPDSAVMFVAGGDAISRALSNAGFHRDHSGVWSRNFTPVDTSDILKWMAFDLPESEAVDMDAAHILSDEGLISFPDIIATPRKKTSSRDRFRSELNAPRKAKPQVVASIAEEEVSIASDRPTLPTPIEIDAAVAALAELASLIAVPPVSLPMETVDVPEIPSEPAIDLTAAEMTAAPAPSDMQLELPGLATVAPAESVDFSSEDNPQLIEVSPATSPAENILQIEDEIVAEREFEMDFAWIVSAGVDDVLHLTGLPSVAPRTHLVCRLAFREDSPSAARRVGMLARSSQSGCPAVRVIAVVRGIEGSGFGGPGDFLVVGDPGAGVGPVLASGALGETAAA